VAFSAHDADVRNNDPLFDLLSDPKLQAYASRSNPGGSGCQQGKRSNIAAI
jgi:hypothetical protein